MKCRLCKHGDFVRNRKSYRVKRDSVGYCLFSHIPESVLSEALNRAVRHISAISRIPSCRNIEIVEYHSKIYYDTDENCPCFEKREKIKK